MLKSMTASNTSNHSARVLTFPTPELPPINTPTPNAYSERAWVMRHRQTRKELREGLASGKYQPTPQLLAALAALEAQLEQDQHIR